MNETAALSGGGSVSKTTRRGPHAPRGAEGESPGITGAALARRCWSAGRKRASAARPSSELRRPWSLPDDPSIVRGDRRVSRGRRSGSTDISRGPLRRAAFHIVLVCHENRGLTRPLRDVTRRVAKAGLRRDRGGSALARRRTARHDFDALPGILARRLPRARAGFQERPRVPRARCLRGGTASDDGLLLTARVTWRVAAGVPDLRVACLFTASRPGGDCARSFGAACSRSTAGSTTASTRTSGIPGGDGQARQDFRKIVYPDVDPRFPQRYRRALQRRCSEGRVGEALAVVRQIPA